MKKEETTTNDVKPDYADAGESLIWRRDRIASSLEEIQKKLDVTIDKANMLKAMVEAQTAERDSIQKRLLGLHDAYFKLFNVPMPAPVAKTP